MSSESLESKLDRFQESLDSFLKQIDSDDKILAAILVGSLNIETIWKRESIHLWLIESDGVTKRLRYDGNDERIFRSFVDEGINIHCELIPRSRFKLMVEGSSRTAFSCNFFAKREIVFCRDTSIKNWFEQANQLATKDQEREKLAVTTWAIWGIRELANRLEYQKDHYLAKEQLVCVAHSVAALEIVKAGEVHEGESIFRGLELNPVLLNKIYVDAIAKKPTKKFLGECLALVNDFLLQNASENLKPLLHFLKKEQRTVPFSELCDHFAFSQLYPWHLESACEWLEVNGLLEKVSSPFKMTKKSRVNVEEPAYALID